MIRFLISLKRRFPQLWNLVEDANGFLFRLRYKDIGTLAASILNNKDTAGCCFSLMDASRLPDLARLLERQDEQYLTWFHPHDFDLDTLNRLFLNPAFLMMAVYEKKGGRLVGYFFLRCFFIGRAFAGLLVDPEWQNRGIGTTIWASCAEICSQARIRMQATLSTENKPSMASCRKGTNFRQVQALEDHYLAIECQQKG